MNIVPPELPTSTDDMSSDEEDHHSIATTTTTTAGFSRISGSIRPSDSTFEIPALKRRRKQKGWLREDGDPTPVTGDKKPYGQDYLDQQEEVRKIMEADENYNFVRLVAGYTDAQVQEYYDVSPVQEFIRRRTLRAQEEAERQRRGGEFVKQLQSQDKRLQTLVEDKEAEIDRLARMRRDAVTAPRNYNAAKKSAIAAMEKTAFVRVDSNSLRDWAKKRFIAKDNYSSAEALFVFDYATRMSVVEHGASGFKSPVFRRQIERAIDQTCQSLKPEKNDVKQVHEAIPLTSRLALYLATLRAVVNSDQLFVATVNNAKHDLGSAYKEKPDLYGQDLEALDALVFFKDRNAGKDDNAEGGNYLQFKKMTYGLYVRLRAMRRNSGSLMPEIPRPNLPQQTSAKNTGPQEYDVGGGKIIIDLDEDLLEGVDVLTADGDEVLTEQQKRQFKNEPYDLPEPGPVDAQALFVDLLKPMFEAAFPFMFYEESQLSPQAEASLFGGHYRNVTPLKMLDLEPNEKADFVDEYDVEFDFSASDQTKQSQSQLEETSADLIIRTRRQKIRGRAKKPLSVEAHLTSIDLQNTASNLGSEWAGFAGVMALAVGIFEHSVRRNTIGETQRHLMRDGMAKYYVFLKSLISVLGRQESSVEAYLKAYRKYLVIDRMLVPVAQILLVYEERLASPDYAGNTLTSFVSSVDMETLRSFLAADESESDYKSVAEQAFEIWEKRIGKSSVPLPPDGLIILTKSNKELEHVSTLVVAFDAVLQEKIREETKTMRDYQQKQKKARDDINKILNETDEQRKKRIENTYNPLVYDPRVALSVENTGIVRLAPIFTSSLASALNKVQSFVPGLENATAPKLQSHPDFKTNFARLVANEIYNTRLSFPNVYRAESAKSRQVTIEQSIIDGFRMAMDRLKRGRPRSRALNLNSRARSVSQQYSSASTYRSTGRVYGPRGYFV